MNMEFIRKLPIPMEIKSLYPITAEMEQIKKERDEEIKKIFLKRSLNIISILES